MKQFFISIIISLFFYPICSVNSFWPGRWNFLDFYKSKNSLKVPRYLQVETKSKNKYKVNYVFDKSHRIKEEILYREKRYIGMTKYEYKKGLLHTIMHYNSNNSLIDSMFYVYDAFNGLRKIIIKKSGGKVDRQMLIYRKGRKIYKTELYDFLNKKTLIINFKYKSQRIKEILFYLPGGRYAQKKIIYYYEKNKLYKRIKIENNTVKKSLIYYDKGLVKKIVFYDEFNRKTKESILMY